MCPDAGDNLAHTEFAKYRQDEGERSVYLGRTVAKDVKLAMLKPKRQRLVKGGQKQMLPMSIYHSLGGNFP